MKKTFLLAFLCLLSTASLFSQQKQQERSLLWKVSGKSITKPTYLFVAYHFLTNAFVDTLPAIKEAYKACEAVVGK
jgi:hypothetical protein